MEKIVIKINGVEMSCYSGMTIMQAAREHGLELPNLCFHPDLSVKANCRICVVEIAGYPNLATACSTQIEAGMEIITDSERVKRSRNLNIELIFSEHIERCPTCVWRLNCKILELADKYKIEITKFDGRKSKRKIYRFANAVEIDGRQCIDCRNCLDVCNNVQKINYLDLRGKGIGQEIAPVNETGGLSFIKKAGKADCIYCGQCVLHCPVGAAQEQTHWQLVEKALRGQAKIMVAQFPSALKVSLGEEFGLAGGKITSAQIVSALKLLGFKYVFDADFGADITTMIEAEELLKKIKSGVRRPLFTSGCPAWVKYIEFYRPDLKPDLIAARSPQMHGAGLIKTYWAEKMKLDAKKIAIVSVAPCTAKKFEAGRAELRIGGSAPVDYVLTARELAWLIKDNRLDFSELKPAADDNLLGASSGAAALRGSSGGVMKSVLSAAEYLLATNQDSIDGRFKDENKSELNQSFLEFKSERGRRGVKEAEIELAGKKLRIAVVNGIGNIKAVLERAEDYDYIEVMACPDGCIGGGGQPMPTTAAIRKKGWRLYIKLMKKIKLAEPMKTRKRFERWPGLKVREN